MEEAVDEIRGNTRRYARRQITWFRHQLPDSARRIDSMAPLEDQVGVALATWEAAGGPSGRRARSEART